MPCTRNSRSEGGTRRGPGEGPRIVWGTCIASAHLPHAPPLPLSPGSKGGVVLGGVFGCGGTPPHGWMDVVGLLVGPVVSGASLLTESVMMCGHLYCLVHAT